MQRVTQLEYVFAAILTIIFFVGVGGFAWWWLIVLFVVFDISAVGYVVNNKIGALTYNIGHSLIGPIVLATIYIVVQNQSILFITLLWLFHIFVDRALGYGLKYQTGFQHTHLGAIGKEKAHE